MNGVNIKNMILEKIKQKQNNKYFAVFLNNKGEQIDVKKLDINKNHFAYDKGEYFYDKFKYNSLQLKNKLKRFTYFLYIKGYSEPIPFYNINLHKSKEKKPYIAEDFYSLLRSDQLRKVNNINGLFGTLDAKKIIIGGCIIIGIIYFLSNGGAV